MEYYNKLPTECKLDVGFIVDPLIATAGTLYTCNLESTNHSPLPMCYVWTIGTAIAAVNILKDWGLKRIIFCSLLGSKAGVEALQAEHPDIEIVVGYVDEMLTEDGYIFPGVGDVSRDCFVLSSTYLLTTPLPIIHLEGWWSFVQDIVLVL